MLQGFARKRHQFQQKYSKIKKNHIPEPYGKCNSLMYYKLMRKNPYEKAVHFSNTQGLLTFTQMKPSRKMFMKVNKQLNWDLLRSHKKKLSFITRTDGITTARERHKPKLKMREILICQTLTQTAPNLSLLTTCNWAGDYRSLPIIYFVPPANYAQLA